MLIVYYQYIFFINIDIVDLKVLLDDLSYTKVAVYFRHRCIANLSLVKLNILLLQINRIWIKVANS